MSKENGGPAFPVADPMLQDPANVAEMKRLANGMTMRDYFAAKALSALVGSSKAGGWHVGPTGSDNEWLAAASYRLADAMLAERAK